MRTWIGLVGAALAGCASGLATMPPPEAEDERVTVAQPGPVPAPEDELVTVTQPGLVPAPEAELPAEGLRLAPRLADCLPPEQGAEALARAMSRAFERHDARCWSAAEIALATRILIARPDDPEALVEAGRHLRQAELRANRHGLDAVAALALVERARISMLRGDAPGVLLHLGHAARAVDLHAAATGEAPEDLDAIHLMRMVEALAEWERKGETRFVDQALESSVRLKAREALRGFAQAGHDPVALARAVDLEEAGRRLTELGRRTRALNELWGQALREATPGRLQVAEAVVETGAAWTMAAPMILDFVPGDLPLVAEGARSVLGAGEVVLDYTVGEDHSVLVLIREEGPAAHALPGRLELEALVAACEAGACEDLAEALLVPVAEALAEARQVLVAAHGVVHRAPFESLLPEHAVYRTPSALALTGLRLRAWGQGPKAHPRAAALFGLPVPPPQPADPGAATQPGAAAQPGEAAQPGAATQPGAAAPSDEAAETEAEDAPPPLPVIEAGTDPGGLAKLRAALSSGLTLTEWSPGGGHPSRRFGAPLTVPATD